MDKRKRIAILGSSVSIGTQALEVVAAHEGYFQVEVLTAHSNAELLIAQAKRFRPNAVVICDEGKYREVHGALDPIDIKVYAGEKALASVVQMDTIDLVLTALVGYAGLLPTIKAIESGKPIALANKETLVVAGDRDPFVPVDHAWGLRRQLPDARLFIAPECGHEVMLCKPALFNEALAGFYRSTAAVATRRAQAGSESPARSRTSEDSR